MKMVEYNISGPVNTETKTNLRNSLNKIEGVQDVAIDIGRSKVEVNYNEPATKDEIRNCIEKTGYDTESDID